MRTSSHHDHISEKVGRFTESVIRRMTRLAVQHGAVNLAQGFPDFPAPTKVKDAAISAIRDEENQYTVTWGTHELREAIADKAKKFNGLQATADENVTVTCGSTEAIVSSMLALTDPGDEVIVPEPFFENYVPSTILSGAKALRVTIRPPDFELDTEGLKLAFSRRPKAIIINTPNNPTGKVYNLDELKLVADLCEDYGVVAITDEIYEQIVYGDNRHVSLATVGNMHDLTVTISGISKTYSLTGWRVGYVVAPKHLTTAIRQVHDFISVCAPAPLQKAAVAALALPDSYYRTLRRSYDRRRRFLLDNLEEIGFRCNNPQGAYYILADFKQLRKGDDYGFAEFLVRDKGVAVVPASSFYSTREVARNQVRFAFPKKEETLAEAVERIRKKLK